jgi:hypothetical protein
VYEKFSPYTALYGCLPTDVLDREDIDPISAGLEVTLPFYRHQVCRIRAAQAIQEAILQNRLSRALSDRPRTEDSANFKVGQAVDVYRKPPRKDLHGWRGPAVIISLDGEGSATVRWQGTLSDVPIHLLRPHVHIIGFAKTCKHYKHEVFMQTRVALEDRGVEAHDHEPLLNDNSFATLMMLCAQLPIGGSQIHYRRTRMVHSSKVVTCFVTLVLFITSQKPQPSGLVSQLSSSQVCSCLRAEDMLRLSEALQKFMLFGGSRIPRTTLTSP